MSDAPIIFGVGAAKAGTSWLHRYLSDHPECHFRSFKELHYFDALEKGRIDSEIEGVKARRAGFLGDLPTATGARLENRRRQIADSDDWLDVLRRGEDPAAYLGYVTAGAEGRLAGDITPAYALLPEPRLRQMASLTSNVRFVYLLRDPVERLWSHVRMIAARRAAKDGRSEGRALHILHRVLKGRESEIEARGDYRGALARLDRAIAPERLLVMVFERLMTRPGVIDLCRFLGIRPIAPDFNRRVHASPSEEMPAEARTLARGWLADQYETVAERLGGMPAGWDHALQKV